MSIRRNDHRRRRVILDEAVAQSVPKVSRGEKRSSVGSVDGDQPDQKAYSTSVLQSSQIRTTDLIPKSFFTVSMVVLTIFGMVATLNVLSYFSPSWNEVIGTESVGIFQLSGVGTISSWFVSFLLVLSSLASIQIYVLRQHRCNDYRGTYRLWKWLAGLFLIGSTLCIVDLGEIAAGVSGYVFAGIATAEVLLGVLIAIKLFGLAAIALRAGFEVRASPGALTMALIIWLAYTSAVVFQIQSVRDQMVLEYTLCFGNCVLIGTSSLLVGVLAYARFVFLHAHGMIEVVARTSTKKLKAEAPKKRSSAKQTSSVPKDTAVASEKRQVGKQDVSTVNSRSLETQKKAAKTLATGTRGVAPASKKPGTSPLSSRLSSSVSNSSSANSNSQTDSQSRNGVDSETDPEIVSLTEKGVLSKSEKRRLKKLQKRQHRAA